MGAPMKIRTVKYRGHSIELQKVTHIYTYVLDGDTFGGHHVTLNGALGDAKSFVDEIVRYKELLDERSDEVDSNPDS